jgi:hypothetical protein
MRSSHERNAVKLLVRKHTLTKTAEDLKAVLYARGFEVSQPFCMDLSARLYGYRNYDDFRGRPEPTEISPRDRHCDPATVRARRLFQKAIMADAGFREIADIVLDIVEPNGPIRPRTLRGLHLRRHRLATGQ